MTTEDYSEDEFGAHLKEGIRKAAQKKRQNITPFIEEYLAGELGVSRSTIYDWQNGKRLPRREEVEKFIAIFERLWHPDEAWIKRFRQLGKVEEVLKEGKNLPFGKALSDGIDRLANRWQKKVVETEESLSEALDVSVGTVRGWKRGDRLPSRDIIIWLVQILDDGKKKSHRWIHKFLESAEFNPIEIKSAIDDFFSSELQEARENRHKMIDRVKKFWIEKVLNNSLQDIPPIEVPLKIKSSLMTSSAGIPWQNQIQIADPSARHLQADEQLIDFIDQSDGTLLILGEPGAGKTITLLNLAAAALDKSQYDLARPIPVIFLLSSWSDGHLPIAEWLVRELKKRYKVPLKIGQNWIAEGKLFLLLDGLDEVPEPSRQRCVDLINQFQQTYEWPLVVASRLADYKALATGLLFQTTVLVEPLPLNVVDSYLQKLGERGKAIRLAVERDPTLQTLVQTPLMLSIWLASQLDDDPIEPSFFNISEVHDSKLFENYVKAMFTRRQPRQLYPTFKTIRHLTWLAQKMRDHNQTILALDQIQPSWLEHKAQNRIYEVGSKLLIAQVFGLPFGFFMGLIMAVGLSGLTWDDLLGIGFQKIIVFLLWWLTGMAIGEVVGLLYAFVTDRHYDSGVQPVETLSWSWKSVRHGFWPGVKRGLGLAIPFAAFLGVLGITLDNLGAGIFFGLITWIIFSLILGLTQGIFSGVEATQLEEKAKSEGISQSLVNSGIIGLFSTILGFPISLFVIALIPILVTLWAIILNRGLPSSNEWILVLIFFLSGWWVFLTLGLIASTMASLVNSLDFGGVAVIRHIMLRIAIWRYGQLPFRLSRFLDHTAERILMRKTGFGYMFIHARFQDYLISLDNKVIEQIFK